MLKYLVAVTEDLLTTGLLCGMLLAFALVHLGRRQGIAYLTGVGGGLIASIIMAVLINTTSLVNIGLTNLTMFFLFIIAFVICVIFLLLKESDDGRMGNLRRWILAITAAVMVFSMMFYALPDVWGYPYNFNLSGNTIFSTDFIYRIIGLVLGFALVVIASVAAYKIQRALPAPYHKIFLLIALLIQALAFAGKAVQIMRTRMMIQPSELTFTIIQITLNYSEWFIFGVAAIVAAAAVFLWGRNLRITEEYRNVAEKRKIRAGMRRRIRWALALIVCVAIATVNLTAVKAYNNKEPEEAPVEDCEITDEACVVPLSMVEDGHLHRFAYTTDDGIEVKFIIVKKPGSTAYGVGLDACDICGDAGYYEQDDQIVCRRCDVVMNTNTIGFKGGCNPIVIDYSVEEGTIVVPLSTLVEHQDEFR